MGNRLIDFLLQHNQSQSALYCSADATLSRERYIAQHPTEIIALKCMDGRVHLPAMTDVPPGIITPMRNIGGQFDLGWPYFGKLMKNWVRYAVSRGQSGIVLVTYHFSKGDTHRGCKGFGYDTEKARAYTRGLKEQIERVFGKEHTVIYPIQLGVETDEDALILHGTNGDMLDMANETSKTVGTLIHRLHALYPDMSERVILDLLPFLEGNIRHIAEVRASRRPIADAEHKEQILAVGRGFDWLHLPNKALIVGPYSYDLRTPIAIAANILLDNMKAGRIPEADGAVLLISAAYRGNAGVDRPMAQEKAQSIAKLAIQTIQEQVPDLAKHLSPLVGTVNLNTRRFSPIEISQLVYNIQG